MACSASLSRYHAAMLSVRLACAPLEYLFSSVCSHNRSDVVSSVTSFLSHSVTMRCVRSCTSSRGLECRQSIYIAKSRLRSSESPRVSIVRSVDNEFTEFLFFSHELVVHVSYLIVKAKDGRNECALFIQKAYPRAAVAKKKKQRKQVVT